MTYNLVEFWQKKGQEPCDIFPPDKIQFIRQFLGKIDFDTVLEVGCGDGQLTRILLEFVDRKNYHGIDISQARIKAHKKYFGDLDVTQKDVRFLDSNQYDLVICSHVLLHIPPNDIKQTLSKLLDMKKKHLVFFEPNPTKSLDWAEYNFNHNYVKILEELGYQTFFYRFDWLTGIYHVC